MKTKLFIFAVLFTASSAITQAQEYRRNEEGKQNQKRITPEQRVEKLAQDVSLTAEEKKKVLELFKQDEAELTKIREEMKLQREAGQQQNAEMTTKMQQMRRNHENELEKIIGKEKFTKMQTIRNQNVQKMKQGASAKGDRMQGKGKNKDQVRQMMTPEKRANHLKSKLALTDEQTLALTELFKKQESQLAEQKQSIQEIMNANDTEIEKIIGKEKMVQWKETRKSQVENMKKK